MDSLTNKIEQVFIDRGAAHDYELIVAIATAVGDGGPIVAGKQVGWCWVEGQSTDEYTCKFQGYRENETQWFIDHKWEPMYIGRPCGELVPRDVIDKAYVDAFLKVKNNVFETLERGGSAKFENPHHAGIDAVYALQLPAPVAEVPSLVTILDMIFANDGGTIEAEGPVPMRIAKAIRAHLLTHTRPDMGSVVEAIDEVMANIGSTVKLSGEADTQENWRRVAEIQRQKFSETLGTLAGIRVTLAAIKAGGGS